MPLPKPIELVAVLFAVAVVASGCQRDRSSEQLESTLTPSLVNYPEERSRAEILREASLTSGGPSPSGAEDFDINRHGDECVAAIGPIPPFSCFDGALIPIT